MSEVVNLGKVCMTAEGNYDPSRSYDKLAVVVYNGLSWVSRKKVPEGVAPSESNSAFWQKISERGERGPQGQSYVDKELVPIVDDLTTGGSANVLSAEQGKVLKQELTELESEVLSSYFIGTGNNYVEKKLTSLVPRKYRIYLDPYTSVPEGTSGYRFKFEAYNATNDSLGVLAYTAMGKDLKSYYDIDIPSAMAYATIGGRCNIGDKFRYIIMPLIEETDDEIYNKKAKSTNIWVDSTSVVTIEENTNKGYLFFSFTLGLNVRRNGSVLMEVTIEELAALLGKELVTSSKGIANCIRLDSQTIVAYDLSNETIVIIGRDSLSTRYVPLIANFSGQCIYVADGIYNAVDAKKEIAESVAESIALVKKNTFISSYSDVDVITKASEFSALLNNSKNMEAYLFFTDPHYGESAGVSMDTDILKTHINIIEKYFNATPTDFVMCGGDWLNSGDTQVEACAKLGYIDGLMNGKFKKYYPILGNHDTNNQGIAYEGAAAYSGVLTNETIANLWFRQWGKNYYDFQTARVHWIVLDTQHDFAPEMNEYKWQQIDWLGEKLKSNTYGNVVIAFHIYWQQESNNEISPITDNALNMAAAFNNKTTITLNGVTYDFSQTRGMVKCAICGHSHKDFNLIHNGVPVIATDRTGASTIPTFDLVCLDFTNKKFKSIRVGNGENRVINIL